MTKKSLRPIAFDIETSGFTTDDVITVAGLRFDAASWLCLHPSSSDPEVDFLQSRVYEQTSRPIKIEVVESEEELLSRLREIAKEKIKPKDYLLVAFNGEVWKGGFDLPFIRGACAIHDVEWPFEGIPYADLMPIYDNRINTTVEDGEDVRDLVGLHAHFFGTDNNCDPFDTSKSAVDSWENSEYADLLLHNLADIERTQDLARLAQRLVPSSDFNLKNLDPPN